MTRVQLIDVGKQYPGRGKGAEPVVAVEDVSIDVASGEIHAVIGYSGAGKSTLLRLVNGLERATSGRILVGEHEISSLPERRVRDVRTNIGMIFQQFNLFSTKTVAQNIAYPLQLDHWRKDYQDRRVSQLLEFQKDHHAQRCAGHGG